MELVTQLTCPCRSNFTYKNNASFSAHKKTKMHISWENQCDNKQDKVRSKEFENEIERLKSRLYQKEAVEAELLKRIYELEKLLYIS